VLKIPRRLVDAMVAHCRAEHPIEACGVLPGPVGGDVPDRIVPMANTEQSPSLYRFDADEQLAVWVSMATRQEWPVVIYHSHTSSRAYPSKTDVAFASLPEAHYVVVSTRDPEAAEVRSFRILDGEVEEEPIEVA
jgi:proteasome lid subunit RPN8/RPN11